MSWDQVCVGHACLKRLAELQADHNDQIIGADLQTRLQNSLKQLQVGKWVFGQAATHLLEA